MNTFVEQEMRGTQLQGLSLKKNGEDTVWEPSDASFDRTRFSDKQYIELLKEENQRLRACLERQSKLIEALNGNLGGRNTRGESDDLVIPQRSAKRNADTRLDPGAIQVTPTRKLRSTSNPLDSEPKQKSLPLRSLLAGDQRTSVYPQMGDQLKKDDKANIKSLDPKWNEPDLEKDLTNEINKDSLQKNSKDVGEGNENLLPQSTHFVQENNRTNPFTDEGSNLAVPGRNTYDSKESKEPPINDTENDESAASRPSKFERLAMLKNLDKEDHQKTEETLKGDNNGSGGTFYRSRIRLPPTLQNNSSHSLRSNKSEDVSALGIFTPYLSNKDSLPKNSNTSQSSFIKSTSSQSQFATPILDTKASMDTPKNQGQKAFEEDPAENYVQNDTLRVDTKPHINDTSELSSTVSSRSPSTSFNVNQSPLVEDTSAFLIKPEEFHTVSMKVVSSLHLQNSGNSSPIKKQEEGICTLSINDKETGKEMWRIRKTYMQLLSLDSSIRPIVEYFGLPYVPERQIFTSSSPAKIAYRKNLLQDYFDTIFRMPHMPQSVLFRMCQFISEDLVNPLDDFKSGARKEGYLIRRHKTIGISWKVRWCQVDGPFLEIYEFPGGPCSELIKLAGSQIGKQNNDNVAEDRGYRHAFLLIEPQKKLGSPSKHFFCAESDEERDDWILALLEFNEENNIQDDVLSLAGSLRSDGTVKPPSEAETTEIRQKMRPQSLLSPTKITSNMNDNFSEKFAQKEFKEQKRMKKRSIFPFRGILNFLGDIPSADATQSSPSQNSRSPQNDKIESESPDIQKYLDQMNLDDNLTNVIFGRELEVAYNLSTHELMGKKIPSICSRCLDFLIRTGGVREEGIFRLSGSASVIRQLKEAFNTNFDLDLFESSLNPDVHTIAGLFKTYLRELPTCILGLLTYKQLKAITASNSEQSKSSLALSFKECMRDFKELHEINYNVSYTIFKFLNYVILQSGRNKMNLRNVCIVFVPTLNISLDVLSTFLVDFDCIFEDGTPIPDEKREVLDLYIPDF